MTADLLCSAAAFAAGDEPAGSATDFESFLLVTELGSWSREAASDAMARQLPPVVADMVNGGSGGLRGFAIRPPDRVRSLPSGSPVYLGRVGGTLRRTELPPDESVIESLVSGVVPAIGDAVTGPLIGVCTNGRRDRCCAIRGRPIVSALAARFGPAITEISHLGGHRYSGTMVIFPTGYEYGFLDPQAAIAVVTDAMNGLVHPRLLRGRAGLAPAAQAAEAWWRGQLGAAPPEAIKITETAVDGDLAAVSAIVEAVAVTLELSLKKGPKITETQCGGKPFVTQHWEVLGSV